MDSQKYLLRQRRNRVWGCAQINTGIDVREYETSFRRIMTSLQTDLKFPMDRVFDSDLREVPPQTDREKDLMKETLRYFGVT